MNSGIYFPSEYDELISIQLLHQLPLHNNSKSSVIYIAVIGTPMVSLSEDNGLINFIFCHISSLLNGVVYNAHKHSLNVRFMVDYIRHICMF